MRLDPEERIIAAALDEAEIEDADERGAGARIEFKPEGHAKVTITISRELVECARALDFTTLDLFVEALRLAVPGAFGTPARFPHDCTDGCTDGAMSPPGGERHPLKAKFDTILMTAATPPVRIPCAVPTRRNRAPGSAEIHRVR